MGLGVFTVALATLGGSGQVVLAKKHDQELRDGLYVAWFYARLREQGMHILTLLVMA